VPLDNGLRGKGRDQRAACIAGLMSCSRHFWGPVRVRATPDMSRTEQCILALSCHSGAPSEPMVTLEGETKAPILADQSYERPAGPYFFFLPQKSFSCGHGAHRQGKKDPQAAAIGEGNRLGQ
jgi:hypothetical protein